MNNWGPEVQEARSRRDEMWDEMEEWSVYRRNTKIKTNDNTNKMIIYCSL